MAALRDVYVNDAFGTAHRAEATTTTGWRGFAAIACAGPADGGGDRRSGRRSSARAPTRRRSSAGRRSRRSSRYSAHWPEGCDQLIVGGGIANTFMLAVGGSASASRSPSRTSSTRRARRSCIAWRRSGGAVPMPVDVVVRERGLGAPRKPNRRRPTDVAADDMILDIGPQSARALEGRLPQGGRHDRLERPGRRVRVQPVRRGHEDVAHAIADEKAFSLAGGGDTHCRDREVRRRRPHLVHFDRRRRVPRVPRREDPAGTRRPDSARRCRDRPSRTPLS